MSTDNVSMLRSSNEIESLRTQLAEAKVEIEGLREAVQDWLDENEDHGPCQCDIGDYNTPPSQCSSCRWNARISPLQQALNSTPPDLYEVEAMMKDAYTYNKVRELLLEAVDECCPGLDTPAKVAVVSKVLDK